MDFLCCFHLSNISLPKFDFVEAVFLETSRCARKGMGFLFANLKLDSTFQKRLPSAGLIRHEKENLRMVEAVFTMEASDVVGLLSAWVENMF